MAWCVRISASVWIAMAAVGCASDRPTAAADASPGERAPGDAAPPDSSIRGDAVATDGPIRDSLANDAGLRADAPGGDSGALQLPGCTTPCAGDQVCADGTCVTPGPARPCPAGRYPANPQPNDGTLHVDRSHAGASDGSASQPFRTIGEALAAIPEGKLYTIAVAAGVYDEALTIAHSLDLYCACPEQVRITQPLRVSPGVPGNAEMVVTIDGCSVIPAGLDPQQACSWPACGAAAYSAGISAVGGAAQLHLRVRDSVVAGWCDGIYFSAEPSPVRDASLCVTRSRVALNERGISSQNAPLLTIPTRVFDECAALSESLSVVRSDLVHNRHCGLCTSLNARGIALHGNRISGTGALCGVTAGAGHGVLAGEAQSALLSGNVIRDSAGRGIALSSHTGNALKVTIENNLVAASHGAGITLRDMVATIGITIAGNRVVATGLAPGAPDADGIQALAIARPGSDVEIVANEVHDSARIGVVLHGVGGTVDGNTITNSGSFGCVLQQSSALLGTNAFSGNAAGQVQSYATEVVPFGGLPLP